MTITGLKDLVIEDGWIKGWRKGVREGVMNRVRERYLDRVIERKNQCAEHQEN